MHDLLTTPREFAQMKNRNASLVKARCGWFLSKLALEVSPFLHYLAFLKVWQQLMQPKELRHA